MLVLKNGKTVYGEIIDIVIDNGTIQDVNVRRRYGETLAHAAVQPVRDRLTHSSDTEAQEPPCGAFGNVPPDSPAQEIDLGGRLVMPGLIDLHTHMREPGLTHKEDFYTGSRACAKGGITTFFDMPNTQPPTVTEQALAEKIAKASQVSAVNFAFHFGASKNDNSGEIRRVIASGAGRTTKVFMNVSTGLMLIEDTTLLSQVFKSGGLVFVHAEHEMIDKAIELNARYGSGVYICHISSKEEMQTVIKAKQNPLLNNRHHPIYAEVTPHHLFLHTALRYTDARNDMLLRMKPELKDKSDSEFLMQAMKDGYVDTIGTDHAPHTIAEKLAQTTFGVPGVETALALMLTAAAEKKIPLPLIQKLMSENPAAIVGLKKKGVLAKGADADITVVDPSLSWQLHSHELESKCQWSPFEGWNFTGKNYMTIVNGCIVYHNSNLTADGQNSHAGRFVFKNDAVPDTITG